MTRVNTKECWEVLLYRTVRVGGMWEVFTHKGTLVFSTVFGWSGVRCVLWLFLFSFCWGVSVLIYTFKFYNSVPCVTALLQVRIPARFWDSAQYICYMFAKSAEVSSREVVHASGAEPF